MTAAREAVRRAVRDAGRRLPDLFAPGTRLVVGFSGGQDSTCLLHALSTTTRAVDVIAAHIDHSLRADSAAGAERAIGLARRMGVQAIVCRVDVAAYHQTRRWSLQHAARAARYQALARILAEVDAQALLVAHTADDQAETVLLNLLRGTGLNGLSGMRFDEQFDPRKLGPPIAADRDAGSVRLVRPLLRTSRATTLAYCAELGLPFVDDASNHSRAYTRNRARLDLLPALERFNPAIRTVLARTADLVGEDVAALREVVEALHAQLAHQHADSTIEYDKHTFNAQPRALRRRLLRKGLESLLGSLVDVPSDPIEDALNVLRSGQAGQVYHLPYGLELRTARDTFELRVHGGARHKSPSKMPNIGRSSDTRV